MTGLEGRTRRALVVVVATIVLAAAGLAGVVVTSTASSSLSRSSDRSVVAGADHHDAITAVARRAGPDVLVGPGIGFLAGVAALVLWAATTSALTAAAGRDRRLRWRARLVGAPPSTS